MFQCEVARKFVIASRRYHKLHLVVCADRVQILHLKCICFAGVRAFHVDNLDHFLRQAPDKSLTARFDHHGISCSKSGSPPVNSTRGTIALDASTPLLRPASSSTRATASSTLIFLPP